MQFKSSYHEARSIDAIAAACIGEQFLHEFVLSFLKTLHAKGHSPQVGDLLLGVAQCKMAQETLVVFVDFIVDEGFLPKQL